MDAFLQTLDGASLIGPEGINGDSFDPGQYVGSTAWELGTQVQFIDVYALNRELDLAIVLENKIGHELNNPLKNYAETALSDGVSKVLVVVLAPEKRDPPPGLAEWHSASITYEMFSAQVKRAPALLEYLLAPVDLDQRRSLDLLQQFIEARSGGPKVSDLTNEATRLAKWRDHIQAHQDALEAFQRVQTEMRRLLKSRNERLDALIAERFQDHGLEPGWEAHGGRSDDVWNAYHFPAIDYSIELKFSTRPDRPVIYVQVYPGRDYKQQEVEDFGLPWSTSDESLADAFVQRVQTLFDDAEASTDSGL